MAVVAAATAILSSVVVVVGGMADSADTDRDRVNYTLRIDRQTYREWSNSFPRSMSIRQRFVQLIEADLDDRVLAPGEQNTIDIEAALEAAESAEIDTGVLALRIRRNCMSAVQDARANGAERAAEQLAEIQSFANELLAIE